MVHNGENSELSLDVLLRSSNSIFAFRFRGSAVLIQNRQARLVYRCPRDDNSPTLSTG